MVAPNHGTHSEAPRPQLNSDDHDFWSQQSVCQVAIPSSPDPMEPTTKNNQTSIWMLLHGVLSADSPTCVAGTCKTLMSDQ